MTLQSAILSSPIPLHSCTIRASTSWSFSHDSLLVWPCKTNWNFRSKNPYQSPARRLPVTTSVLVIKRQRGNWLNYIRELWVSTNMNNPTPQSVPQQATSDYVPILLEWEKKKTTRQSTNHQPWTSSILHVDETSCTLHVRQRRRTEKINTPSPPICTETRDLETVPNDQG